MRDAAFLTLVGIVAAIALANLVLVLTGLLPYYLGVMSIIAAFIAIGFAIAQVRG